MSSAKPKVLIPCAESDWQSKIALPKLDNNIFGRIIRNPHSNSLNPKERECTEMLCAMLRNTSVVQQHVLKYFAGMFGQYDLDWDELRFEFQTEQSIGAKRDDLRIMGWNDAGEESELSVLWTIEVKVGSSFHDSSSIMEENLESVGDTLLVNQVTNYDYWLSGQSAQHRGGIVFALTDCTESLPDGLQCKWVCTSWTRLGETVGLALGDQRVPEGERLLAKHVLGFIRHYLWRESEMEDSRIGFDDIALLRAFSAYGLDLEKKVDGMVSGLKSLVQEFGFEESSLTHRKSLYKPMGETILYKSYVGEEVSYYPELQIGISRESAGVWLKTAPNNENKITVTAVIQDLLPALKQKNQDWRKEDRSRD